MCDHYHNPSNPEKEAILLRNIYHGEETRDVFSIIQTIMQRFYYAEIRSHLPANSPSRPWFSFHNTGPFRDFVNVEIICGGTIV